MVVAASVLLAASSLAAPLAVAKVAPGNLKCAVQPYDNAWRWTVLFPDGHVKTQGIWSDHLELTNVDGREVLKRVQGMSYVSGLSMVLITTADPHTCTPFSVERHTVGGEVIKRRFAGRKIITERTGPGGLVRSTAVDVAAPVFDFGDGQEALLLTSLPLRVGYEAIIASIDETSSSDSLKPVTIRVLREETVRDLRHLPAKAFVVESDDPGQSRSIFWISKAAPYFLRLEVEFPDHRYRLIFNQI